MKGPIAQHKKMAMGMPIPQHKGKPEIGRAHV